MQICRATLRLLWNMATCKKNQRKYVQVLRLVERYEREGGPSLTAQRRRRSRNVRTVRLLRRAPSTSSSKNLAPRCSSMMSRWERRLSPSPCSSTSGAANSAFPSLDSKSSSSCKTSRAVPEVTFNVALHPAVP